MVSIANNAYSTNSLYYKPYEKLTEASSLSTGAKPETESRATSSSGDTVTLSDGIAAARTREAMGLNPTGQLRLSDFRTAAENQTQIINTKLESFMKEQGIDDDQTITLSLDSKSNITIKENFSGKSKLEKAMNGDKDFTSAFRALGANSGILDYTDELKTRINSKSLADFMDSDPDWSDLMTLASTYTEMKSSSNPLATLVSIRQSQTPYEFRYEP